MPNSQLGYTSPVSVSGAQKQSFLEFAERAIVAAGAAALPYFRTDLEVENKLSDGQFDPVTQADRAVEQRLREAIHAELPEHGIYGEEFGHESGNGLTWVIDPIDGTRAFMTGMLHWGTLLALFDGQQPIVGAMYQPYVGDLFLGDNSSAWFVRQGKRRPLRTSACESLADAVLATTGTGWFPADKLACFDRLEPQVKMTRVGGDCYVHALVAMGGIDLATDASLQTYDIQGLMPIVRGAGGVVTGYEGEDVSLGGTVLCSANETLHRKALEVLQGE